MTPREHAKLEAEVTYRGFLTFLKYLSYGFIAIIIVASFNNWGADGTGSKYDPALEEEYLDRIKEMNERYKK